MGTSRRLPKNCGSMAKPVTRANPNWLARQPLQSSETLCGRPMISASIWKSPKMDMRQALAMRNLKSAGRIFGKFLYDKKAKKQTKRSHVSPEMSTPLMRLGVQKREMVLSRQKAKTSQTALFLASAERFCQIGFRFTMAKNTR